MRRTTLGALVACAALAACDNTDPVSPQAITVIVNAEPPTVEVGQTSTITVSAFRPDGSPTARAPVNVETTLGTLASSQFLLDGSGQGSTVLDAGEEPGTATITATVTDDDQEVTGILDVEITTPEPPEAGAGATIPACRRVSMPNSSACRSPSPI
ncbi:MAG: hypothetical protein ACRD2Z_02720 [Thermoanaerobaculia bacterium]